MNLKQEALDLLALGFSVIPLIPGTKKARVSWGIYQERRATVAEVEAWWNEEPESGIGIVTGAISGIIVADIDPRNGGTLEAMGGELANRAASTGGGGWHLYFRHPGDRRVTSHPTFKPGIDCKADGGYVVAPPTPGYAWLMEKELGDPPAWMLSEPAPTPGITAGGTRESWIAKAFEEGAKPGTQADTMARLSGYLAARSVPVDIATGIMQGWAANLEQDERDPWRPEQVAQTVESVYRTAARRPAPATFEIDDGDAGLVVDKLVELSLADGHLPLMPLADFIPKYIGDQAGWLVTDWIPNKTIAFLVSPPGGFKTWLTFDLAVSVAGGWPFLGQYPVQHPGPVIVLQQEDSYGDIAQRFHHIHAARQPVKPKLEEYRDGFLSYLPGSPIPPVYVSTSRGFECAGDHLRALERDIRDLGARLVIIDPLYAVTSTEDFMQNAARDLFPLKSLRDAYGTTFAVVSHTNKAGGNTRGRLWGSQFLNAFLETGIQIHKDDDGAPNQIEVRRHSKSSSPFPPLLLEFHIDALDSDDPYKVDVLPLLEKGDSDGKGAEAATRRD